MRATAERLRRPGFAVGLTLLAVATLAIEAGFNLRAEPVLRQVVVALDHVLVVLVALQLLAWLKALRADFLRRRWFDLTLVVAAVAFLALGVPRAAGALVIARQLVEGGRLLGTTPLARRLAQRLQLRPLQILALSYLSAIGLGTFLLTFPAATADAQGADLLTALFTATSAVCVTGLIVVDTGTYFASFGQTVILLLIQVGGLGIMTFSAAMAILLRRRLGFREQGLMQDILEESSVQAFKDLVRRSATVTFVFEGVGAALLFLRFVIAGEPVLGSLSTAVFHSVSAFCNAGFSLYSDSLTRFVGDPFVNLVVVILIVGGGLGFAVVMELSTPRRRRRKALSVHTRLAVLTSALFLGAGTILFFFFEFDSSLAGLPLGSRVLAAFFQSTTLRTAGFNTVDFSILQPETLLMAMAFMFIGGSSGSTAGGIKVTTAAVLALSVRSMLTGRPDVELFGRSIPKQVIYRSVAITFISFALVLFFLIVLLRTQELPFLDIAFETVSAFGTVGLSTGATARLDTLGRLLIVVLMFIGRTGPLTLALAVGERPVPGQFSYPEERVVVG